MSARRFRLLTLLRGSLILSSLTLYLAACFFIYAFQIRQNRQDVHYLLYSEAEALASYVASTGKLDFPELGEIEEAVPAPVWLRVVENGKVLAATPHFPSIPLPSEDEVARLFALDGEQSGAAPAAEEDEAEEALEDLSFIEVRSSDGIAFPVVRHQVWNRPGTFVEALTRPDAAQRRMQKLIATLMLTGLILVPLATAIAELAARQLQRPLDELIAAIGGIEAQNLGSRLAVRGRVAEIAGLTEAFNQLLGRVETEVRRMRRFTANASHELRTPIASLRAGIDVCLRRPRGAEEYRLQLEESLREIDRVQRVVEGLLALAREAEGAGRSGERRRIELAPLLERVSRVLQPIAGEKQIVLHVSAVGEVAVVGDESQLELMLINLVDNAIRHGPRQSEVTVEARREHGQVRLAVADQGPGIPPAERPLVFDRYFQGQGESGSPRLGGIGLDLVRWVVGVHGGQAKVADGPTPGARFEILLPAAKAADGAP